jgi:hypothetical protein
MSSFPGGTVWHACPALGRTIPFKNVNPGATSINCHACRQSVPCVAGPDPMPAPYANAPVSPYAPQYANVQPYAPQIDTTPPGQLYHSMSGTREPRQRPVQNNGSMNWDGMSGTIVMPELRFGNSQ